MHTNKNSEEKSKKFDIHRRTQSKKDLFNNILELLRINFEIILLKLDQHRVHPSKEAELLKPRPKNLVPHVSSTDIIAYGKEKSGYWNPQIRIDPDRL